MPAAAVIPAPRAYINVVAVKKPVVGFEMSAGGRAAARCIALERSFDVAERARCRWSSARLHDGRRQTRCGIVHWLDRRLGCVTDA